MKCKYVHVRTCMHHIQATYTYVCVYVVMSVSVMCMYVHTYVRIYANLSKSFVYVYVHTFHRFSLHLYVRTYVLRTYVCTCVLVNILYVRMQRMRTCIHVEVWSIHHHFFTQPYYLPQYTSTNIHNIQVLMNIPLIRTTLYSATSPSINIVIWEINALLK